MCSERGWQGEGDAGQRRNFLQLEKGGGGVWLRGEQGERAGAGGGIRAVAQPTRGLAALSAGTGQRPGGVAGDGAGDSAVYFGGGGRQSCEVCPCERLALCF